MTTPLTIPQKKIGCSHQAVFDMRHKLLIALQQFPEIGNVRLGEVSEFDEALIIFEGHISDGTPALCDRRSMCSTVHG